jgi:hypothetical protein
MLDPLGAVQIGAREIYDELKTVGQKVDTVGAKVDGVVAEVTDHETRIRALERNRWPLPSIAALAAVASLIVAVFALLNGA